MGVVARVPEGSSGLQGLARCQGFRKLFSLSLTITWEEEISEAEVEAGLAKIHASTWGQATVQCCFPRCSARALALIKDRLSFAHCFRVHPSQVVHGLPGSTLQSPAATRHWGHEAWLS